MDIPKICFEFANSCIWQFKSILNNRKRGVRYMEVVHPEDGVSLYDLAKQNETKTRNLQQALALYTKAALNGEKLNSCIKDFASVLHQSGYTQQAIRFLQQMRPIYKGDAQKYQKLIINLSSQLRPTGKHEYKNILIDLIDMRVETQNTIMEMFGNCTRIKNISFYQNLGFMAKVHKGRFVLLEFDSFSAAKKTMETFKDDQWFAVNRYWIDVDYCVVAESYDAKTDFQRSLLFSKGNIIKVQGKCITETKIQIQIPNFNEILGYEGLELVNETSIYLIHYYHFLRKFEECPNPQ